MAANGRMQLRANIEAAMPVILWLLGEPFVIVIAVLSAHPI
jgi:hypothetical protein